MASGKTLDGVDRSRPLFPYPLFAKFMGGDPNEPANFAPEHDGSVRWKRFHKDTFYAFEIVPELKDDKNPVMEGEGLRYFQPYDNPQLKENPGTYGWQVWSPSMFEAGFRPGFFGSFDVE